MKRRWICFLLSMIFTLCLITPVQAEEKQEKSANQLAKSISTKKWLKQSNKRYEWSWAYPEKFVKKYDGYYNMGKKKKNLYLTFDVGYATKDTWKILKTLRKNKIKAVFFVTYPVARDEPKLIKRIIKDGHILGNHSTKHGDYTKLSLSKMKKDFLKIHNYVLKKYDYRMEYFRYPEGTFSKRTLYFNQKMHYKTLFWDFAYYDYDANHQLSSDTAYRTITNKLHNGSILLLHGQSKTNGKVLGRVIKYAKKKGYTFCSFE